MLKNGRLNWKKKRAKEYPRMEPGRVGYIFEDQKFSQDEMENIDVDSCV
jgi:hypothetical protein